MLWHFRNESKVAHDFFWQLLFGTCEGVEWAPVSERNLLMSMLFAVRVWKIKLCKDLDVGCWCCCRFLKVGAWNEYCSSSELLCCGSGVARVVDSLLLWLLQGDWRRVAELCSLVSRCSSLAVEARWRSCCCCSRSGMRSGQQAGVDVKQFGSVVARCML